VKNRKKSFRVDVDVQKAWDAIQITAPGKADPIFRRIAICREVARAIGLAKPGTYSISVRRVKRAA
jgi:hypothetical protein